MQLELEDFRETTTKQADDQGWITLGSGYAGETVKVVVVEIEGEE